MNTLGKVLLVDDDPASIYLSTRLLIKEDLAEEILSARNGLEATHLLLGGRYRPDYILLDLHMPVMDGLGFLTALGMGPGHLPPKVILLTSSDNPKDLEKAYRYPIEAVLTKPLTAKALEEALLGEPSSDKGAT